MEHLTVTQKIIKWARDGLPDWQSDLVRRYLENGRISKDDVDEIYLVVLSRTGIELTEGKQPQFMHKPELGEISGAPQEPIDVSVKAIRELKNVNQIPDGSALTFGETGLTVIYGENGAGKSGWARLLKRACRAKDEEEPILPNVYESSNSGHAGALFHVFIKGKSVTEIPWSDGSSTNDILTNITVFDSKAAGAIINNENTFLYVPKAMNVFSQLADAVLQVRQRLEREKPQPSTPNIPEIDPNSSIGQRLSDITNAASIEYIKSMATWWDTDSQNLNSLTKRLAEINAGDVRKRIDTQKAQIHRVGLLLDRLSARYQAINETSLVLYASQGREFMECKKAAEIASQEKLSDEPLNGPGSDAWEMLYRAAKLFSEEVAYPGRLYPPVDDGDRCVLCMQELLPEAQTRMMRFKEFVEGAVQRKLENARDRVNESRSKLDYLFDVETNEIIRGAIDEVETIDSTTATTLNKWIDMSNNLSAMASTLLQGEKLDEDLPSVEDPKAYLESLIVQLKKDKENLEASLDPTEVDIIRKEITELQSRKAVFDHWNEIETYWSIIEEARKYEVAIDQLNTTSITKQGKRMMSTIVNDQLNSAVANELLLLGADRLSLDLSGRGDKGEVKYRYTLGKLASTDNVDLRRVLSEGEQRVVALAGFLAEENLTERSSTIVFDDPVSSLDHLFREKIAERLATESQRRQVIVFTHDIAFLFLLQEKSTSMPMFVHTLRRFGSTVGNPESRLPWHATPVKKRLTFCRELLQHARKIYETDPDAYDRKAAEVYAHLRETWEAAIEETFLNGTIIRHGHTVQTKRLQKVNLTDVYYVKIERGMAKCSNWMVGHDTSKNLSDHRPEPDEIAKDIEELHELIKEVTKYGDETERRRKKQLGPLWSS